MLLASGRPLALRRNSELESPATAEKLSEEEVWAVIRDVLDEKALERLQQQGSVTVRRALENGSGRLRLSAFLRLGRPALVIRSLESGGKTMPELRLPSTVARLADFERGLVIVAGASGSGRSTTLAALVHQINRTRSVHLVTCEEPVEFVHTDLRATISQREVGSDVEDWSEAVNSALLTSPDVLVVDEVTDEQTFVAVLRWALAGKLVFCTVEGRDVAGSLRRLLKLVADDTAAQWAAELGLCLQGIVCQKLVPSADDRGKIPATELLIPDTSISQLIRELRLEELVEYIRGCNEAGMFSFNQSLAALFKNGLIRRDVALAYCGNEIEFRAAIGESRAPEPRRNWDLMALLNLAVEHDASDLHMSEGRPPIMRIGGGLEKLKMPRLRSRDIRSMLYSVLTGRQRADFERDKELDLSLAIDEGTRFRVNAFYQKGNVACAFRTIPSRIPDANSLGIPEALIRVATKPHGLVLVVGPTGSGKTTTLACLVDQINRTRPCHIITVEDPIEYSHSSLVATVDQREVHSDTHSFANALKYVLRQDPDVIMVGEMRDLETISAALTAAETGHLVFATLHTNDACQTIDRIVDVFPPHQQPQIRQQVAASLLAVVSQRLVQRADEVGRVAAFELLIATPAIRSLIRDGKTHQMLNVLSTSANLGMTTLDRSLARLFQRGLVAFEEAARFVSDPEILRNPERVGLG